MRFIDSYIRPDSYAPEPVEEYDYFGESLLVMGCVFAELWG